MSNKRWHLKCLLCEKTADELKADGVPFDKGDLVSIQEHAMNDHGVSSNDMRRQRRYDLSAEGTGNQRKFTYQLPDDRVWLVATEV